MEYLVRHLIRTGVLRTQRIIEAFRQVDRADFVLPPDRPLAYEDIPLPIGHNQTISQPSTVAFMLEWLDAHPEQNVLDVGSGSGWTTALLGRIVGPRGRVYGVEIVPELVEMGRRNATEQQNNISIEQATDELGLPAQAPFDRILVSASANELPHALVDQLITTGSIVIPIRDEIWKITKTARGTLDIERFPGFRFVPLKTTR